MHPATAGGTVLKRPPSPPASSPTDVLAEFGHIDRSPVHDELDALRAAHSKLQAEHAALQSEARAASGAFAAQHAAESATEARLSLVRDLLDPLSRLERLVSFEELRCASTGVAHPPLLPALVTCLGRVHSALGEHGIEPIEPEAGEPFDRRLHEVEALLGKQRAASTAANAAAEGREERGTASVVSECHLHGLRHGASATVLRRALVVTKPSVTSADLYTSAAASAALATPTSGGDGGTIVHELQPSDTMQGVALRYGVSPAAIARANKLPAGSASSLHLRTRLLIPPATPVTPRTVGGGRARSDPMRPSRDSRELHEWSGGEESEEDDSEEEAAAEEAAPLRFSYTRRAASSTATPRRESVGPLAKFMSLIDTSRC